MIDTEYIYATLLLHSAGREISEESVRKVLEAAGIAVDEVELKRLVAAVKQINIDEVLKQAVGVPVVAAPQMPATQTQAAAPKEEKREEVKEEKKEEVSEEQIAEGLAALFG
ncbi:MAG: 50S ribosomal protein P1 [Sulfolobales archaeon]